MTDILDNIDIHVDCHQCDASFDIAAGVVAQSHEMLEDGCPGTDYECPASLFATLVDREALRRLADAWRAIEQSVRDSVGAVSLRAHPTIEQLLAAAQTPGDDRDALDSGGSDPTAVTVTVGGREAAPDTEDA